MSIYILPEVKKRQAAGDLPVPLDLRSAQIIFPPKDMEPEVRINSEVRGIAQVKARRPIAKGEQVWATDIEAFESVRLGEEDDPDCAHATLIKVRDEWIIGFDFRRNKGLARQHLDAAVQFLECAKFSESRGHDSSFVDNLFSACELVCRATLLTLSGPDFREKSTHKAIKQRFNRYVRVGNAKSEYAEVLNRVAELRERARYVRGPLQVSREDRQELLGVVKEMLDEARKDIS